MVRRLRCRGDVDWEDLHFSFSAPLRTLQKAQTAGIENRICRLASSIVRKGGDAIDVGANYGFVSTIVCLSLRPPSRLLSFEIEPGIGRVVEESMRRNRIGDRCIVIKRGAGAQSDGRFVSVDDEVTRQRLDKVSFVKIDVDGPDCDVLLGARRVLERDHPVVVIEMSKRQDDILNVLRDCGYRYFGDLHDNAVNRSSWPDNLVASLEKVSIPHRGSLGTG